MLTRCVCLKTAVWLALANLCATILLGILDIALPCDSSLPAVVDAPFAPAYNCYVPATSTPSSVPPAGGVACLRTLTCDKYFKDNKSIVFMVFAALQLSNVYNGVVEENFYELFASFGVTLLSTLDAVLVTAARQKSSSSHDDELGHQTVTWLLLIVAVAYQITVFVLAYPIYRVYNRRMHQKIGSDPRTQQLYREHLLALTCLKFQCCFAVIAILCSGDGVFDLFRPGKFGIGEFIGAIVSMILVIVWAGVGWMAMEKENRVLMIIFFVGCLMSPVYCSVYFVLSYWSKNHYLYSAMYMPDSGIGSFYLFVSFVVYACITLSIHVGLVYYSIMRFRAFGRGLLDTLKAEVERKVKEGRTDDGFAHLDSDEEFDLDVTFDRNTNLEYHRMSDAI